MVRREIALSAAGILARGPVRGRAGHRIGLACRCAGRRAAARRPRRMDRLRALRHAAPARSHRTGRRGALHALRRQALSQPDRAAVGAAAAGGHRADRLPRRQRVPDRRDGRRRQPQRHHAVERRRGAVQLRHAVRGGAGGAHHRAVPADVPERAGTAADRARARPAASVRPAGAARRRADPPVGHDRDLHAGRGGGADQGGAHGGAGSGHRPVGLCRADRVHDHRAVDRPAAVLARARPDAAAGRPGPCAHRPGCRYASRRTHRRRGPPMTTADTPSAPSPQPARPLRAAAHGLATCERCGLLARLPAAREAARAALAQEEVSEPTAAPVCPRCLAPIHVRKPDSLRRCWALLLAAAAMYLPANMLPVMITETLFGTQQDTILSGIVYLWTSGSWHLAIIVFIASFFVPLAKLGILAVLCLSVRQRWRWKPRTRTRLYVIVEAIGRWSMLDVFVIALLAGLVHLSTLAVIKPGPGVAPFAGVVVLTMLAARCFDPRLIWDAIDEPDSEETTA
ncbi:paraquat-inducible protein a [Ralstonia solanacearum Po82]|uniref:Paraquat-inducible protein a n=4 Tax=Ralstonia solanacearum TaxID=305 RepID=F6G518_RALS8|nr:paraquat-inducible protein a [Ralstonia solanacearum Po82]